MGTTIVILLIILTIALLALAVIVVINERILDKLRKEVWSMIQSERAQAFALQVRVVRLEEQNSAKET